MEGRRNHQAGGRIGKNASPRLNLPQARAYADFKIGELFELKKGKRLTKAAMLPGSIRFIGATATNNGITAFVGNDKYVHPANTITVSYNGSVGEAFYQTERFWASDDINVFYAKFKLTETRALYVIPMIKQQGKKYTYSNKWTKEKMEEDCICLPVISKGSRQLDLDYMDAYIRALEAARIKEVDAYLKSAGLDSCVLTDDEESVYKEFSEGTVRVEKFNVGSLFFVKSNPQLNKENFVFSDDAEYPYFTRTVFNNGILGYVNYLDEKHKIDGGSLAVGMLGLQFFYMAHDFYAGQFTKSIRLKEGVLNERTGLFFATLFNSAKGEFQKGLVRDFERLFASLEICLPVDSSGAVDYGKLDVFVSAIIKQTIRGVVEWKDREIAATRRAAGQDG